MQEAAELKISRLVTDNTFDSGKRMFVGTVLLWTFVSATLASLLPLPVSIITVLLFAGPHNWFELRYFLMRLPVRFGKSRHFFLTAFVGVGVLTVSYVSLPLMYRATAFSNDAWLNVIGSWNTMLLAWLALLVWLRVKQKPQTDWTWVFPIILALGAFNWFGPELFSLSLVYIHPLVALWFLDKHLQRNRPQWLQTYRRLLGLVPVVVGLMIWQLWASRSLSEDNGLFWRITQHAGSELLPRISSHLLVSVHLFLEMLHYGVWILALPLLISKPRSNSEHSYSRFWELKSLPLARHPRGFPRTIVVALTLGLAFVVLLGVGFSIDYATTRDIYFTIAMAHVVAEAPFLMKML